LRVLLNFLPLKTGGGVQVAMDFLRQAERYGKEHEWFIVARQGGAFSSYGGTANIKLVQSVPDNIVSRLFFEYYGCKKLIREIDPALIYTQFGPQWPAAKCINVVGCAYSNLFYPELDFWGKLPWAKRLIKRVIDGQRLRRVLQADVRIFETKDLADRAVDQYGLDEQEVKFVRAAASSLVAKDAYHAETMERCKRIPAGINILLLAGYHPNKNIEFLVDAAQVLRERKMKGVRFVLTIPANRVEARRLLDRVEQLGLGDFIFNFGPVAQQGCVELYRACDFTVLPSTLESFSNMIAESWAMEKPLLISDLSWCRSLCSDAAIYYDYLNPCSLVDKIQLLIDSDQASIVAAGTAQLASYPTSEQRFKNYLDIIESSTLIGE